MMDKQTSKNLVKDAFHNNNEVEWLQFPYKISDVDEKINLELLKDFTGERTGFIQVGPKKWFFPNAFKKTLEIYYNFQPRPTDVWIVTFPRSGTTWAQELLWLLSNDLNYEKASQIPLDARFPFLEFSSFVHPDVKEEFLNENRHSDEKCALINEVTAPAWKILAETTERRFIKTHLPFQLLPPNLLKIGCKVIYVARNPKDVAVSFYHLNRLFRTQGYTNDFPKYWYYFKNGLQPWTPYWAHIEEGWETRHEENLLFMFYEDMLKDLQCCLRKVATFLGVKYSNQEYEKLQEHLKFENFKNNKSVNAELLKDLGILKGDEEGFVRKGKSGGWRNYFIGELKKDADIWIEDNLKKTGIQFPTENLYNN
ncbi:sulfotransferase 1E1 [Tribolium madens]|uniref:sulfotransferase 1E1 n=1 Tax=Tribolium madens TaxID=41895 RepID=UPI001CF74E56|nr:sulfotransferase 1E1 [Tribolium madens]